MVVVPGATAVARPVALMVATAGVLLTQVAEPVTSVRSPPGPTRVAVNWMVWPTLRVGVAGVTSTVKYGSKTRRLYVPVIAPRVAVMVVL